MANRASTGAIVPLRKALNMEIIINQALIDIQVDNGILTQEGLLAKIVKIRRDMPGVT